MRKTGMGSVCVCVCVREREGERENVLRHQMLLKKKRCR